MLALGDRERAFIAMYASFSAAAAPGASMFEDSEPEQAPDEGTTLARSMSEMPRQGKQAAPRQAAPKHDEAQPRRLLRPLDERRGELDKVKVLRVGDVVEYRAKDAKKGDKPRKMRVISAGVPWLEPCPGSGDITPVDISDRDALKRAWGKPFDPLMYTVLCDMEYGSEVYYTLNFPSVPIMTYLATYVHKALRQLCGGTDGRGSSWNTAVFRNVGPLGPHDTLFRFSEFPKDAYAKPKTRAGAGAAAEPKVPEPEPEPEVELDPDEAEPPRAAPALVKKGGAPKPPAKQAAIGTMFARAAPAARVPSPEAAVAFLESACGVPGLAGHMARSLLEDMQAQRAAGAPEEERMKTLWGLHPGSNTPTMTMAELETFIGNDMRARDRVKADAAMYALRVTRGVFGRLFQAVPADYCLPAVNAGSKKRKPPADDFDM